MRRNSPSRRNVDNVRKASHDLGIDYPVAIDNNFAIWRALNNQYWPAHYFVDAQGQIRHHHFGEGEYAESEQVIQQLLVEAGHASAASVATGLTKAAHKASSSPPTAPTCARRKPTSAISARRISRHPAARRGTRCTTMHAPQATLGQRLGSRRRVEGRRRTRDARRDAGPHRLSLSCARPASGAGTVAGRQAGALSRDASTAPRRAPRTAATSPPTAAAR